MSVFQYSRPDRSYISTEPSPLLAPPHQIPALQQDRVMEEFETETLSEPLTPIKETLISQVQPLLGTTHRENLQLQNRILDVLGTTAFPGYVNTPAQTLDSIVVQQPKRFLLLTEEAKHLAENTYRKIE